MNFRLNTQTTTILSLLEKKLHQSKTAIVEQALKSYAQETLSHSPLLKYAGKLETQTAEKLLSAIKSNRKNKKFNVDL